MPVYEVKPSRALGDRTAFDGLIRYRTADDARRFVAIETKYTEPFSTKVYDNPRYRAVTEESNWFQPDAAAVLRASSTNQLWRGLMLASLTETDSGDGGRYTVIAPADDNTARAAVATVSAALTDASRLNSSRSKTS